MSAIFDNFLKDIWETTRASNIRNSTSFNDTYNYQNATSKLLTLILAMVNTSIQVPLTPPNTTSLTRNQPPSAFGINQIETGVNETNFKQLFSQDYVLINFWCIVFFSISVIGCLPSCCRFFFYEKNTQGVEIQQNRRSIYKRNTESAPYFDVFSAKEMSTFNKNAKNALTNNVKKAQDKKSVKFAENTILNEKLNNKVFGSTQNDEKNSDDSFDL
ncbi:unnamed protein product [Brachionus calyciflorus]|uniref:Uncharacterized protein n=1 Tax=Brachionus calyciflorus TaxID=104777 RepID=A0A814CVA5_9BILA|nr:unnamed protein product [Brachionus calyciflorus]